MKSIENVMTVLFLAAAVLLLPAFIRYRTAASAASCSADAAVQEMLQSVGAVGHLRSADYERCMEALYYCGYRGELYIEATVREVGTDGVYSYRIVWDEIADGLMENGMYMFPENCYIIASASGDIGSAAGLCSVFFSLKPVRQYIYIGGGI